MQPNNYKNAHIQRFESTYLFRCFFLCFFFTYKYKKYIQTLYIIYTTKLKYMNSIIVPIRMTPVQKKELTDKANENHLKLSTWIRQTILNNLDNE